MSPGSLNWLQEKVRARLGLDAVQRLCAQIRAREEYSSASLATVLSNGSVARRLATNLELAAAFRYVDRIEDAIHCAERILALSGFDEAYLDTYAELMTLANRPESIADACKRMGVHALRSGRLADALRLFNRGHHAVANHRVSEAYTFDFEVLDALRGAASAHRGADIAPSKSKDGLTRVAYLVFGATHPGSVIISMLCAFAKHHDRSKFHIEFFLAEAAPSKELEAGCSAWDANLGKLGSFGCAVHTGHVRSPQSAVQDTLEALRRFGPDVLVTPAVLADYAHYYIAATRPATAVIGLAYGSPQLFTAPVLDLAICSHPHISYESLCDTAVVRVETELVDPASVAAATPADLGFAQDSVRLYVGGRPPKLKEPRLWRAWAQVLRNCPEACLIVAGVPDLPEVALRELEGIDLSRVRAVPWGHRYLEILKCADIVLDTFPFGGGVLGVDAMALGKPVLTFAHASEGPFDPMQWSPVAAVLPADLVVPRGDFRSYVERLTELVRDPLERARAGKSCRLHAEDLCGSPSRMVSGCEQLYRWVLDKVISPTRTDKVSKALVLARTGLLRASWGIALRTGLRTTILCLRLASRAFLPAPGSRKGNVVLALPGSIDEALANALQIDDAAGAQSASMLIDCRIQSPEPVRSFKPSTPPLTEASHLLAGAWRALSQLLESGASAVMLPAAPARATLAWLLAGRALKVPVTVVARQVAPSASRWAARLDWFVVRNADRRLGFGRDAAERLSAHYGVHFAPIHDDALAGHAVQNGNVAHVQLGIHTGLQARDLPGHWFEESSLPTPPAAAGLRIVQVTGHDLLGLQAGGFVLHREMRRRGIDSRMLVNHKLSEDPAVEQLGSPALRRLNGAAVRLQSRLSLYDTLPVTSLGLPSHPWVKAADVVNLQVVHNGQFFNLSTLAPLARTTSVVLSLHDMYFMTGHCVHPMSCERWTSGCGNCPDLETPFELKRDTTARLWAAKERAFSGSDIRLVVHSPWMLDRVKRSPYLSRLPVRLVPFGIDPRVFFPIDKRAARAALGIPPNAHVIAFRATPAEERFKGARYIEEALLRYRPSRNTVLLALEHSEALQELRRRYRFVDLGWVIDPRTVATALSAADVFLMPSLAEAFGLMAIESMACGTPAIVFEGTALPHTIGAPDSGIAVPRGDSEALCAAITALMEDDEGRQAMARRGIEHVARHYTMENYVNTYLDVYREARESRRAAGRAGSVAA